MTETIVRIESVGWRGEGLARHEGEAIAIAATLPGESVRAVVTGVQGRLVEVVEPSPERIEAFCPHFGRCGGCQLQHWREDRYRAWKLGLVEQALKLRDIEARGTVMVDAHGSGRRRVSLHVRKKDGKAAAGYMASRSHDLVDIDLCPILVPGLAPAFDIAREVGAIVGNCDVGLTATDTGLDVHIKAERAAPPSRHSRLAALAENLKLARLTLNAETIVTRHAPRITMGRASVAIPPGGFLQATAQGEEALAALVIEGLSPMKLAADLFCGMGPFALRIAERAGVAAFDSDRAAIDALKLAARQASGLKPVAAQVRNLFREPLTARELKGFDAAVFDPPRAGAEAQAMQLAKSGIFRIVAISCDAQSFARDARILIDGGYRLAKLTAVDQFKWSSHVEIVAAFARNVR